jgi:hypothetical protein
VDEFGIQEVLGALGVPQQRAYVERVIGTIRRECLDHVIVFNEASLRRQMSLFLKYYHGSRTHLSLAKDTPESRPAQLAESGRVVAAAASWRFASSVRTSSRVRGAGNCFSGQSEVVRPPFCVVWRL